MGLPATMRAAVCRGKGRMEIEEHPLPDPGRPDALLLASRCGVCGTAPHLVTDGWGRAGSIRGHGLAAGRIAGGRMPAPGARSEG